MSGRSRSRRPGGRSPVDMGFIVYNERDVSPVRRPPRGARGGDPGQRHELRAGTATACGVAFSSRGADRRVPRDTRPVSAPAAQWRMLGGRRRFYREAARRSTRPSASLGDARGAWLDAAAATAAVPASTSSCPITSAVWSTAADRVLDFPVDYLLRFLDNHGLIGFGSARHWRVVQGGSRTYVERIVERLPPGIGGTTRR